VENASAPAGRADFFDPALRRRQVRIVCCVAVEEFQIAGVDVVVFAGYISGHDVDKWQAAKLTAVKPSKISVPLIGEAIGNVEYKVVNQIPFDETMDLFVGEVLATHIRKGAMEGELYREDSNPLLYMGTKYDSEGKSAGKYYAQLKSVGKADYESPLLKQYLSQPKRRPEKSD